MNRRTLFSALAATTIMGAATWSSTVGTKNGKRPIELDNQHGKVA